MEGVRRGGGIPGGTCRTPLARPGIQAGADGAFEGPTMTAAFTLMMIYRLMALFVAAMMVYVIWRERDWRPQLYAALVLVPFLLRGLGVK